MGPARLLSTLAGLFLATGLFAFPKLPAVDRHGDPLPPGAVGRLGTVQLRARCESLHFSADGKTLIGVDGRTIHTLDAANGSPVEVHYLPGPETVRVRPSGDGRTLMVSTERSMEMWDLPSGKRVGLPLPTNRSWPSVIAVSNDRRWVLVIDAFPLPAKRLRGGTLLIDSVEDLVLWDTTNGTSRTLVKEETDLALPRVSGDGRRVAATRDNSVWVWDAATGKRLWSASGYRPGEIQFTPDGKYLIAAPWGGGNGNWKAWNSNTGEPVDTLRLPAIVGRTFIVAPDGNLLLISTSDEYVVWDMKTGAVRHTWPGANWRGQGVFAPDGRSVVTYDTILRRWDLATGKNTFPDLSGLGHTAPIREIFFAPDGTRLLSVGEDRTARSWDVATAKPTRSIPVPRNVHSWAMHPDGRSLFGLDDDLTVHRWPLTAPGRETAAELREARGSDTRLCIRDARLNTEGRLVLLQTSPLPLLEHANWFYISVWDVETGQLIAQRRVESRAFHGETSPRLSADCRQVAGAEDVYDVRTGVRQSLPAGPFGLGGRSVFSPDGRLLAIQNNRDIRIWEIATRRVLIDLPADSMEWTAFSRVIGFFADGRRLVYTDGERITVRDVISRSTVIDWSAPRQSGPIAFSPDGRTVATGHSDGTILLWRVPAPVIEGRWSAGEGAALWQDLGDETPGNAWTAVWQLADHPADAVRLLQGKYPLTPVAAAGEFAKLIAGLDSPKFAEREKASRRLAELGRAAERPLRLALKASPTPEQAKRIESLLAAREPPTTRPRGEDLRAVRAVAVLEACATEDARRLLADWAERGPPRLSDEAARAVERLKWQPVRP